jgi:hypothetical protein
VQHEQLPRATRQECAANAQRASTQAEFRTVTGLRKVTQRAIKGTEQMTDKEITHAARQICAAQCENQDNSDGQLYLSGGWDHTIWMRLVEQGIRRGIETERTATADWFLKHNQRQLADSVRRGDHMKESK